MRRFVVSLLIFPLLGGVVQAQERPDILFISVDDLNDWVGVLGGHPQALTPNMDALADRGILFTNAQSVPTLLPLTVIRCRLTLTGLPWLLMTERWETGR